MELLDFLSVVLPNFIWAVVVVWLGIIIINLLKGKNALKRQENEAAREYELKLKEKNFKQEEYWHEKGLEDKEKALDLKIKEFKELTLHQKILDKVIEKSTDEKVTDLEKALKELTKKYESLNGEIEQIIIKKKQ